MEDDFLASVVLIHTFGVKPAAALQQSTDEIFNPFSPRFKKCIYAPSVIHSSVFFTWTVSKAFK